MIQARISGAAAPGEQQPAQDRVDREARERAGGAVDVRVAVVGVGPVPRQEDTEREQQAADHGEVLGASETAEVHAVATL